MPSKRRKQRISAAVKNNKGKAVKTETAESETASVSTNVDSPVGDIEENVVSSGEASGSIDKCTMRDDGNGESKTRFKWPEVSTSKLNVMLDETLAWVPSSEEKGRLLSSSPCQVAASLGCPYPTSSSGGLTPKRPNRFAVSSVDIPLDTWPKSSLESKEKSSSRRFAQVVTQAAKQAADQSFSSRRSNDNPFYQNWNSEGFQWNTSPGKSPPQSFGKSGNYWTGSPVKIPFNSVELSDSLQKNYQRSIDNQHARLQTIHPDSVNGQVAAASLESHFTLPVVQNSPPFSEEMLTAALTIVNNSDVYPKPTIFVIPLRTVNFANLCIQFTIQIYNVPPPAFVTPQMVEAIAESPSGQSLLCYIRPEKDPGSSALTTLLGSFKATKEIGLYNIRVRVTFPLSMYDKQRARLHNDYGVFGDTIDVLVSRNYFRDSKRVPGFAFQLELLSVERIPCGESMITSSKAWGLTCDKETNRFYFTERVGSRVTCVDYYGRVLFRFNQNTPGSQLNRPTGICCDQQNRRIILCDKDHHRVCFFTMEGEFTSSFGMLGYQNGMFNYPWDVDVNRNGDRIVVTDSRNKRIQLFDGNGNFICKYSVFEQNPFEYKQKFDYPRGIAFDPDGAIIYVTDFNTHNILQIPLDCSHGKKILPHERLARPQGIVVDQLGNLLVADSRNNCICHFSGDGQLLSIIRAIGVNVLQYPVNMAIMQGGKRIALLDGRGRIHIF